MIANAPAGLPRIQEVGIDVSVAIFTVLLTLGVSLLVGILPALLATRGDLRSGLHAADRGSSVGGSRIRSALVFAEIALSTVL